MEGAFGCRLGGILSLDLLVENHKKAVEVELIDRGQRLRHLCADDHDFSWGDLAAIVEWPLHDSPIVRSVNPEDWHWRLESHLLAEAVDTLHLLWWAKTEAGQDGRNRPKQIPRPGIDDDTERYGNEPVSMLEMNEFLGWEAA